MTALERFDAHQAAHSAAIDRVEQQIRALARDIAEYRAWRKETR